MNASDAQAKIFLDCLNDCFLHQNVIEPTFQNNVGEMTNVLDQILTECKNRIFGLIHLPPLGDINHGHHTINFKYSFMNGTIGNKFIYEKINYNKGNYYEMGKYFKTINWSREFQNMDVNSCYEKWLSLYHEGSKKLLNYQIIRETMEQFG